MVQVGWPLHRAVARVSSTSVIFSRRFWMFCSSCPSCVTVHSLTKEIYRTFQHAIPKAKTIEARKNQVLDYWISEIPISRRLCRRRLCLCWLRHVAGPSPAATQSPTRFRICMWNHRTFQVLQEWEWQEWLQPQKSIWMNLNSPCEFLHFLKLFHHVPSLEDPPLFPHALFPFHYLPLVAGHRKWLPHRRQPLVLPRQAAQEWLPPT